MGLGTANPLPHPPQAGVHRRGARAGAGLLPAHDPDHAAHLPAPFQRPFLQEARAAAEREPVLASFLHMTVIMHATLEKSMAFLLANKLASSTLLGTQLTRLFMEAYEVGGPNGGVVCRCVLQALLGMGLHEGVCVCACARVYLCLQGCLLGSCALESTPIPPMHNG